MKNTNVLERTKSPIKHNAILHPTQNYKNYNPLNCFCLPCQDANSTIYNTHILHNNCCSRTFHKNTESQMINHRCNSHSLEFHDVDTQNLQELALTKENKFLGKKKNKSHLYHQQLTLFLAQNSDRCRPHRLSNCVVGGCAK